MLYMAFNFLFFLNSNKTWKEKKKETKHLGTNEMFKNNNQNIILHNTPISYTNTPIL